MVFRKSPGFLKSFKVSCQNLNVCGFARLAVLDPPLTCARNDLFKCSH